MFGKFPILAVSTTASATSTTISTGVRNRPGTYHDYGAYLIYPDGSVIYYISGIAVSYGRTPSRTRRSLNYLICNIHGMFHDMEILISSMLYMMIPTEIKTPSTVMVLGAYVKKRRDIY